MLNNLAKPDECSKISNAMTILFYLQKSFFDLIFFFVTISKFCFRMNVELTSHYLTNLKKAQFFWAFLYHVMSMCQGHCWSIRNNTAGATRPLGRH